MDEVLSCVITILFFAAFFWGWRSYENKARENVKNDLERKGCKEIELIRIWEFGRRDIAFDVKYCNALGEMIVNSCIVAAGFFSPGDVYWKNPI